MIKPGTSTRNSPLSAKFGTESKNLLWDYRLTRYRREILISISMGNASTVTKLTKVSGKQLDFYSTENRFNFFSKTWFELQT